METRVSNDEFCLYLWRSVDSPGTLYLARSIDSAEAVYTELMKEGYIVRAVHMATDSEYVLCDGTLLPASPAGGGQAQMETGR